MVTTEPFTAVEIAHHSHADVDAPTTAGSANQTSARCSSENAHVAVGSRLSPLAERLGALHGAVDVEIRDRVHVVLGPAASPDLDPAVDGGAIHTGAQVCAPRHFEPG